MIKHLQEDDEEQNGADTKGRIPNKKEMKTMEVAKSSFTPVDVGFILAHGRVISSQEALKDACPINWDKGVLDGKYSCESIIKSKDEED